MTHPSASRLPVRGAVSRDAWALVFLAFVSLFVLVSDAGNVAVTLPLLIGLSVATAFYWVLWSRRYPLVPWFEPGAVYLGVVTLYMAYPMAGFVALGGHYTPFNDARLFSLQPGAAEVGRIGWLYVAHVAGFAAAYVVVRGRLRIAAPAIRRPGLPLFLAVAVVYCAIQAFELVLGMFFNARAGSYAGTYLAARNLPLLLGQLMNHFGGMKYVLTLMLLAALFSRFPSSRPILLAWITLVALASVARLGSRTEVVLLIMAATMMYHLCVRSLPPRTIVVAAVLGLAGFLGLGLVRGFTLGSGNLPWNPFAFANEFENLFANAVHLARVKDSIGPLPGAFHFSDVAALVPQQIAPFTKIDRADWYVRTFFPGYAAVGGGLAFGAIAEAVLTGGWSSALLRGLALGAILASVQRFHARHSDRFWVLVFYVWLTTLSYQLFRNTTFSLLVLLVYRFIPAVIIVSLLAAAIRRTAYSTTRARRSPALGI